MAMLVGAAVTSRDALAGAGEALAGPDDAPGDRGFAHDAARTKGRIASPLLASRSLMAG
jgi:hypothetical protein